MGVAVQLHWLAVGAIVPWAAAGTGVLATQADADLAAGRRGLELLADSRSAAKTPASLLCDDPHAAVSQIAVLDTAGQATVHTGGRCVAEADHRSGAGWSVQANMMLRPTVPDAMAAAWAESPGVPLAPCMLKSCAPRRPRAVTCAASVRCDADREPQAGPAAGHDPGRPGRRPRRSAQ